MAEHKIVVEVNGDAGNSSELTEALAEKSQSVDISSIAKSMGSNLKGGPTSALSSLAGKFAKIAPIAFAVKGALQIADGVVGRLGTYTGDTLLQNDVDNIKKGFQMAGNALVDPIGFAINMAFTITDFNLKKKKANLEASYRLYVLNYEQKGIKL